MNSAEDGYARGVMMSKQHFIEGNIYKRLHYMLNELEKEEAKLHRIAHRCNEIRLEAIKLAHNEGEATSIWLAEECHRRSKML